MKERPILFSVPMIRALLDGSKSQTRRLVTQATSVVNHPWHELDFGDAFVDRGPSPAGNPGPYLQVAGPDSSRQRVYPRWRAGDRLWVRETFALIWPGESPPENERDNLVEYRADGHAKYPGSWPDDAGDDAACPKWRPSIFMPRWASRLTLEIKSVRVERLQDISEADALAEGVVERNSVIGAEQGFGSSMRTSAVQAFEELWDSTRAPWASSPWVWCLSFERIEADAKEVVNGQAYQGAVRSTHARRTRDRAAPLRRVRRPLRLQSGS